MWVHLNVLLKNKTGHHTASVNKIIIDCIKFMKIKDLCWAVPFAVSATRFQRYRHTVTLHNTLVILLFNKC
jgi:hypothetical protein